LVLFEENASPSNSANQPTSQLKLVVPDNDKIDANVDEIQTTSAFTITTKGHGC